MSTSLDINDQIDTFKEYFEFYPPKLNSKIQVLEFSKLAEFNTELAEELIENPEDTIKICKISLADETLSTMSIDINDKVDKVDNNNTFPDYCINNKLKLLYLLSVDKTIEYSVAKDKLGMDKSAFSKLLFREDVKNGVVDMGLCQLVVNNNHVNSNVNSKALKNTPLGNEYIEKIAQDYKQRSKPLVTSNNNLHISIINIPKSCHVEIANLRSKDLNKLRVIKGVVRRASDVRPQAVNARFECPGCGNSMIVLQLDKKFKEPSNCSCGRKGRFRLVSKELVDVQLLVVQSENKTDSKIDIILKDVLTAVGNFDFITGKNVEIVGILKEVPITGRDGGKLTRFDFIFEAVTLNILGESKIELNSEDIAIINKFASNHKEKTLYELEKKFATRIEGYGSVKQALLLQRVLSEDPAYLFKPTRLKLNIGLWGKQGTGKSVLAKEAQKLYSKSVFADCSAASGVGLTASVVRDEFLGGYALEAGSVILAGNDLCITDELDKLHMDDSQKLGKPLEENEVNVNKATINATLKANARILALGNFISYEDSIISPSLVNLKPHIFERFDLVFRAKAVSPQALAKKIFNIISPQDDTLFLRKYFTYASDHVIDYRIEESLQDKLTTFYDIVLKGSYESGLHFGARFLESLRRLCYASAKLRLAPCVAECDVNIAIDIMKASLADRGYQLKVEEFVR